jgi:hypothetical protein
MEFANRTNSAALHFESIDQHGALFHIVVMRQTFRIDAAGLVSHDLQRPIRDTDAYFDDDPMQSVRQEADLCPFKPFSDVIVNAVAHAPSGIPARRFQVGLRVESNQPTHAAPVAVRRDEAPGASGQHTVDSPRLVRLIDKLLVVTGERHVVRRSLPVRWCAWVLGAATLGLVRLPPWRVTRPEPFTSLPLRWESAYGGEHRIEEQLGKREKQVRQVGAKYCLSAEQAAQHPSVAEGKAAPVAHIVHEQNPLGVGFATQWYLTSSGASDLSAPRVEYPDRPFTSQLFWNTARGKDRPSPAGLGAVGRAWLPRRALIGEMDADAHWDDDAIPSLPPEFDHRYWNCAPVDQQCPHLRGGEFFTLVNLVAPSGPASETKAVADNVLRFQLPEAAPFLAIGDTGGRIGVKPCLLDTVYIDPEAGIVELVWRATIPAEALPAEVELRYAGSAEDRAQLAAFSLLDEACRASVDEMKKGGTWPAKL